jgi:hypothetical protein
LTAERWAELAGLLAALGLVKQAQPADAYFTNPTSK